MASGTDVVVRLIGDSTSAINAAKDTENAYERMGDKLKSVGKTMSLAVSLPLAAAGVAAIKELESAEKVAAQTNAVIQSTGGAANVSAKQVAELATAISEKSGMDDEAIASGENLLLTFTRVHNEAGKGNDIFNQATKLSADLSVAWGIDMTQAATKVGKALNDPIAGVSALSKVGVTFTAEQKDLIKSLVDTGDVMGAQKVILKELATEVGGSAAAYGDTLGGQIDKARETLLNAGASIVSVFAPAIRLAGEAVKGLAGFLGGLPPAAQQAVGVFALLVAAVGPALTIFGNLAKVGSAVKAGFDAMVSGFVGLQAAAAAAETSVGAAAASLLIFVGAVAATVAILAGIGFGIDAIFGTNLTGGLDEINDALDRGKEKGKAWGDAIIAGAQASANPVEELRARLATLRTAMDAAAAAAAAGKLTDEQRAETYARISTAIDVTKSALQNAKQAAVEEAAANAVAKEQLDAAAAAARGFAGATNEQLAALNAVANATLAAQGGAIGYAAAQLNVESAQKRVDDLIAGGSVPTSLEYRQATNQLEQANLAAAAAAVKMATDNQTLANILADKGVGGLVAFRDQLLLTIFTSGDASGAIQRQVDKVNALIAANGGVPPFVETHYSAPGVDAAIQKARELDAAANDASRPRTLIITVAAEISEGAAALGGAVTWPHTAMVPGPVMRSGPSGASVVPSGAAVAPTATGAVGGGGGGSSQTFNIKVDVKPGTSASEVGAAVVDHIRAYERVAGRAWRS